MHDDDNGVLGGRTLGWVGRDATCRLAPSRLGRGKALAEEEERRCRRRRERRRQDGERMVSPQKRGE